MSIKGEIVIPKISIRSRLLRWMRLHIRFEKFSPIELPMRFFAFPFAVISNRAVPYTLRRFFDIFLANDPLNTDLGPHPHISILIPCHSKDVKILPLCLLGAIESVENPISEIVLITNTDFISNNFWHSALSVLEEKNIKYRVVHQDEIIPRNIQDSLKEFYPNSRFGWFLQQVLKLKWVMDSSSTYTLVIDSDTILLKKKLWINSTDMQILEIAGEYQSPYMKHLDAFMPGRKFSPFSYVTHHQLINRNYLYEIFPGGLSDILAWIRPSHDPETSTPSEYQLYGEWVVGKHKKRFRFAKWGNTHLHIDMKILEGKTSVSYDYLRNSWPESCSISYHQL